jgi:hypothetical protein
VPIALGERRGRRIDTGHGTAKVGNEHL